MQNLPDTSFYFFPPGKRVKLIAF